MKKFFQHISNRIQKRRVKLVLSISRASYDSIAIIRDNTHARDDSNSILYAITLCLRLILHVNEGGRIILIDNDSLEMTELDIRDPDHLAL